MRWATRASYRIISTVPSEKRRLRSFQDSPVHEGNALEKRLSGRLEQHLLYAHRHQTLDVRHLQNSFLKFKIRARSLKDAQAQLDIHAGSDEESPGKAARDTREDQAKRVWISEEAGPRSRRNGVSHSCGARSETVRARESTEPLSLSSKRRSEREREGRESGQAQSAGRERLRTAERAFRVQSD